MSLLIRPALPAEAEELRALVGADLPLPVVDADHVAAGAVFGAWEGSRLTGFFALEEREGHWWLAHLWVAAAQRGRGRGRWLFTDAVRRARRLGADSLRLTPEPAAYPFFQRLGATAAPDGQAELEVDVTAWLEPLAESVSELGSAE